MACHWHGATRGVGPPAIAKHEVLYFYALNALQYILCNAVLNAVQAVQKMQ